jgi:hypothetical protein
MGIPLPSIFHSTSCPAGPLAPEGCFSALLAEQVDFFSALYNFPAVSNESIFGRPQIPFFCAKFFPTIFE